MVQITQRARRVIPHTEFKLRQQEKKNRELIKINKRLRKDKKQLEHELDLISVKKNVTPQDQNRIDLILSLVILTVVAMLVFDICPK